MSGYDDNVQDYEINEEGYAVQPKTWYEKGLDWCKEHKLIVCLSVIGLPVIAAFAGAKLFGKTKIVEKEPDPTIFDRYNQVPVRTMTTTEFEYVLKDEYDSHSES